MRLGSGFLILAAGAAALLTAQERPVLEWQRVLPLAWGGEPAALEGPLPPSPPPPSPSTGPILADLSVDGTLQIRDGRGRIQLKTGLPGRPLRGWRDGGWPLPEAFGLWAFPADAPLTQGLGALQWCSADFRPFLRGLLWVLEDSEAFLTVIHPGTGRLIHLPLPPGRDLRIRFLPDRLEIRAGEVERGAPSHWSLPWMGLLPRLSDLCPRPNPPKSGGALSPFPRD